MGSARGSATTDGGPLHQTGRPRPFVLVEGKAPNLLVEAPRDTRQLAASCISRDRHLAMAALARELDEERWTDLPGAKRLERTGLGDKPVGGPA